MYTFSSDLFNQAMKYGDGQFLIYLGTVLPLGTLIMILLFIYGVYMKTYLIPLMQQEYQIRQVIETNTLLIQLVHINESIFQNKTIVLFGVLHTCIALLLFTLIRVVNTVPGNVPREWLNKINNEIHQYIQNENNIIKKTQSSQTSTSFSSEIDEEQRIQLNIRAKIELIDKQGRRFCKNCAAFKPKRCHHCRQCKSCWLKMDHHCQWLNNCIGLNNYKLFVNLLMYAWASLGFIVITYSRCYYDTLHSYVSDFHLFLVTFTFLFTLMMFALLSAFTSFHLWSRAIKSNVTTLEYCENKTRGTVGKSTYENFNEVFGTNPLLWFLPLQASINEDLE